ncbi:g2827 [Coccomyxa viridis]|uniref:catalase n=1 Tax=Coccomyxa viridis TaxID=1274662 RepID=A0ABP1FLC1_9CHLO
MAQANGASANGKGNCKDKNVSCMPSVNFNTKELTTNTGAPVISNEFSLRAGNRGPVLLEDYHLLEKLGQFNREKIPERVVHARGMGAKGYFEVTKDITELSAAAFLKEIGKKCPVTARLSTVVHERGSPESLRDVRGFSVKFYTEEGNWDFVGNDIPVFFIRDGIQFVDLVHCLRPNPKTNIQEGWRILDFLSHHPESVHILTWLLDDNGIPANWANMEGYGVNTFKLINAEGQENLCKFHVLPKEGAKFLTNEEAQSVGELNMRHSHATHDLYNRIRDGNPPEWTWYVQTMPVSADPAEVGFDPLDDTKLWPEDKFPLQEFGKMVLDENIQNYFSDVESIAFDPGVTVPGIAVSNDPVLQTRVLAYADTQRYRLGVNYQLLPINMPKCPFHNNHMDGAMNYTIRDEEVNYWPSNVEHAGETQQAKYMKTFYSSEPINGQRVKEDLFVGDDYIQAGDRIRSMDEGRKERFLTNVMGWMTDPKTTEEIRQKWFAIWSRTDKDFGALVKEKCSGEEAGHPAMAGATKA